MRAPRAMLAASVCRVLVCVRVRLTRRRAVCADACCSVCVARLLLGYVYPAYACFKALERRKPDGVRAWCEYWCVRAAASARCNRPPSCCAPRASRAGMTRDCHRRLVLAVFTVLESVGDQTVFWRAPRCLRRRRTLVARSARPAHGPRAPQAAAVQRDEGGVRHLALAPPHAGAPRPQHTRTSPAFSAPPPPNLTPNA